MNNRKVEYRKPILVTGSHRSGSTWVGKMIALSNQIEFILEPFKPSTIYCKDVINYWFTYVCDENEEDYVNSIQDCLQFNYKFFSYIPFIQSPKDFAKLLIAQSKFFRGRVLNKLPLVKDPIAVFSAEWLYKRFDMEVIVLIRHPAGFAGSLKKAGWKFPFDHFLKQPLLMEYLDQFESEIIEFSEKEKDIVEQAILLWNIIHYVIQQYYSNYKNEWYFIRHEDISRSPIKEFGNLYNWLNLSYTQEIQSKIRDYTHVDTAKAESNLRRNSKSTIWNWKERLTDYEIDKVKELTKNISENFYTEEDWIK